MTCHQRPTVDVLPSDCTRSGPFVRGSTYGTPSWNYNIVILACYAQSTASGQGLIKSIPFTLAP